MKDKNTNKANELTDEEILTHIRENSKKEGTVEYYMFGLLSTAEPRVLAHFENQAVLFYKAGLEIGKQMREAEDDPTKKAEWMSLFDRVTTGVAKGFQNNKDEQNDI